MLCERLHSLMKIHFIISYYISFNVLKSKVHNKPAANRTLNATHSCFLVTGTFSSAWSVLSVCNSQWDEKEVRCLTPYLFPSSAPERKWCVQFFLLWDLPADMAISGALINDQSIKTLSVQSACFTASPQTYEVSDNQRTGSNQRRREAQTVKCWNAFLLDDQNLLSMD